MFWSYVSTVENSQGWSAIMSFKSIMKNSNTWVQRQWLIVWREGSSAKLSIMGEGVWSHSRQQWRVYHMATMKRILYGSDKKYFVWQRLKVSCMATIKSTLNGNNGINVFRMAALKSIEEGRPLLKDCFRRCHSLSLIRHGQDWIRGVEG